MYDEHMDDVSLHTHPYTYIHTYIGTIWYSDFLVVLIMWASSGSSPYQHEASNAVNDFTVQVYETNPI